MAASWGYEEHNGPSHWHKWFPIATAGSRQSPVDIKVASCSKNEKLKEVMAKYTPMAGLRLENTGASWMLKMDGMTSSLTGGPLNNEYGVAQMHAHWGSKDGVGSEHTIDGKSYDAELHIVHYNTKYGEISAAVDKPDGLAVLGMFLKLGKEHKELGKICESLEDIQMKKDATALQDSIDPANFLPKNKTYYTYPGSLTTPPLLESVTWIVFKEPIEVSKKQLLSMQGLSSCTEDDESLISENCRGTCSLGNRVVHIYVEGKKQIDDECASVDICPQRVMENTEKNRKKDILNDNLCEKAGECDDNIEIMTKSGSFWDTVNDHKNGSIEVSREHSNENYVNVKKKERETMVGKEDIPEVNGNVTKVEEESYSEPKILADPTEEPPPVPGVPLLMPVCIAGLALAIPLSIYLVTRK